MSRIGRLPIPVPAGANVTLANRDIVVKGPRGELNWQLPEGINLEQTDGTIRISRESEEGPVRALHGLTRALVSNMVTGVTAGFQKVLIINGVGYRAVKDGNNLRLALGYSHPVEIIAPPGITFDVPAPTRVVVSGVNKELVGEVAAKIRSKRPPEPYLGKGIRYENEVIRRKAGKAGKVGGK
jgi:large subunit ribosomal protein L6